MSGVMVNKDDGRSEENLLEALKTTMEREEDGENKGKEGERKL